MSDRARARQIADEQAAPIAGISWGRVRSRHPDCVTRTRRLAVDRGCPGRQRGLHYLATGLHSREVALALLLRRGRVWEEVQAAFRVVGDGRVDDALLFAFFRNSPVTLTVAKSLPVDER